MAEENPRRTNDVTRRKLLLRARLCLLCIIAGLIVSISIILFVKPQTAFFYAHFGPGTWVEDKFPFMASWITILYESIHMTYNNYPVIAYCMDWLVFAHIVLLIFFTGALIDPLRNAWIIKAGIMTCAVMIPFAFISGFIRGIPFFWLMLDCSFATVGLVPLCLAYKYIKEICSNSVA